MNQKMKKTFLALTASMMWVQLATPAPAASVSYPVSVVTDSCAVPALPQTRPVFYIDPVRGAYNGDGSQAHPWDTLENVMRNNIKDIPADSLIYLYTGNHGNVFINKFNTDFVEVTAAPGQKPILNSLSVVGAKWFFSGLTIQGTQDVSKAHTFTHVAIYSEGTTPTNNIIVTNNIINSDDTLNPSDLVKNWSQKDWLAKALPGISVDGRGGTNCITVSNNNISDVVQGASMFADHSLFTSNTINNFGHDAVDYGGNYLTLSKNVVTNANNLNDGVHLDGFQGFEPGGKGYNATSFTDVTLDSNVVIAQTDPNLKFPTYIHGLDNFAGTMLDWYNVVVTNNVVITNASEGINFGSVHTGLIANNTILSDGRTTQTLVDSPAGVPILETENSNNVALVLTSINNGNKGHPSDHMTVEKNLAFHIINRTVDPSNVFEKNIAVSMIAGPGVNTSNHILTQVGSTGVTVTENNSLLIPSILSSFAVFEPKFFAYDLTMTPKSLAFGYGSTVPVIVNTTK